MSHLEERDWHQFEASEGRGYMLVDKNGRYLSYEDPILSVHGMQVVSVVGTAYQKEALRNAAFAAGQPLSLIAEPQNPHDGNAVGVWDADTRMQLGFIPREIAPQVSETLQHGNELRALSVWEWRAPGEESRRGIKILVGYVLPPIRRRYMFTLNPRIEGTVLTLKGKTDLPETSEIFWEVEHLGTQRSEMGTVPIEHGSYKTTLEVSSWSHGRLRISVSAEVEDWSVEQEEELRWGPVDIERLLQPVSMRDGELAFSRMVDRNLLGSELEKADQIETAIALYEANIRDGFEGNGPYDRLAIIYRRQKKIKEEIRVLQRAIEVFSAYQGPRTDVAPKLQKFRSRLEKARRIQSSG